MSFLSVEEALEQVTSGIVPLTSEMVDIRMAHKRVLSDDLASKITQPPFAASAMDGFAVRAEDIADLPTTLKIIGQAAAGHAFSGHVGKSEAVRIFTGAPVPDGANTVLIQENAEFSGHTVNVLEGATHGAYIRPEGFDFSKGDVLLTKGRLLNARDLALAAAMNLGSLPVVRKPKIAVLATGDELVLPGVQPRSDQIISSIPYGLAALIDMAGGEAVLLGIAEDNLDSLGDALQRIKDANILVTIGGASVGDHDLVQKALKLAGMELNFWKIAMRPGKPLMFGQLGATRVLGVPGNPVSAHICARIFLVPMIHRLCGRRPVDDKDVTAVLGVDLPQNSARQHYMRARFSDNSENEHVVVPAESQDSSLLATFSKSDCLIIRPPHAPELPAGSIVSILPLDF